MAYTYSVPAGNMSEIVLLLWLVTLAQCMQVPSAERTHLERADTDQPSQARSHAHNSSDAGSPAAHSDQAKPEHTSPAWAPPDAPIISTVAPATTGAPQPQDRTTQVVPNPPVKEEAGLQVKVEAAAEPLPRAHVAAPSPHAALPAAALCSPGPQLPPPPAPASLPSAAVDRFLAPGGVTRQPHRILSIDDMSRGTQRGGGGAAPQWSAVRPATVQRAHISGARIVGQVRDSSMHGGPNPTLAPADGTSATVCHAPATSSSFRALRICMLQQ